MEQVRPVTLASEHVRLEPLSLEHVEGQKELLGARKDGILRHHAVRRDGTIRDTVMYSMTAGEWPEAKAELKARLARPRD